MQYSTNQTICIFYISTLHVTSYLETQYYMTMVLEVLKDIYEIKFSSLIIQISQN